MTIKKYRKKPVVIEAHQFNDIEDYMEIIEWVEQSGNTPSADEFEYRTPIMLIPTSEGTMAANPGDYIIRGVEGEFYPCKPDIFNKTYEQVNK